MRVSVELPDPKTNGLDAALAKQFADIQRQLMQMVEAKDDSAKSMHSMMMECMQEQQQTLVKAMERLMTMMTHRPKDTGSAQQMVEMMQQLRSTLADLPDDLKETLDRQYQSMQTKVLRTDVKPQVTVRLPQELMTRIDSLEEALLHGLRRSRSRTFGSNY